MKNAIYQFLIGAIIFFSGCEIIPDLNPDSSNGSEISIFVINDTLPIEIVSTIFDPPERWTRRQFSIINDSIPDIEFRVNNICSGWEDKGVVTIDVNGEILASLSRNAENQFQVYPLKSNTSSIQNLNIFTPEKSVLFNTVSQYWGISCASIVEGSPSDGKNYIMIKLKDNNDLRYGWIEYFSNLSMVGTAPFWDQGNFIITRIGIAKKPGFVLKAGQEKL